MNRRELMVGVTALATATAIPTVAGAVRFPERPSVPDDAFKAWRDLSKRLSPLARRYWNGELDMNSLHREFADLVDRSLQVLERREPVLWHGRATLISEVLVSKSSSMFFSVGPTDNLVLSLYVDGQSVGTTSIIDRKKIDRIISHT